MSARSLATRWLAVGVVLVAFALVLAAGCGSSDKWEGTWVKVDDEKTGLEIEKKSDTVYNVHDPDGSNSFDATLSGDTLKGKIDMATEGGKPDMAEVALTLKGDKITFKLDYKGQSMSWDLKKK